MNSHDRRVLFSHNKEDWGTPPDLYARLNRIYQFDFDAACSKENSLAPRGAHYPEHDGLTASWEGARVWCNPPYSRNIGNWIAKAESEAANAILIVMLVPARTDTAWWHLAMKSARAEFLRGRLRFHGAPASAPFPSALLYWNC